MPSDFLTLVHRDHADLQLELTQLLDPEATAIELRMALDGVRLGLTAHAEAEDIVLGMFDAIPKLVGLIRQARDAHLAQESALSSLVSARPQTAAWRERAAHLRDLVASHARHEERHLLPALRECAPDQYRVLAGKFATERLRQLAMLQPSAPIVLPVFAC
ncbi:MAG: hemerythrin domain-containing protein [Kofleriaceae bacterium]